MASAIAIDVRDCPASILLIRALLHPAD